MQPGRPPPRIARVPWRRLTAPGTARDAERGVTQRLVGQLEWMVAFWQGTTAAISALVDTFRFDWVGYALGAVAIAHFLSVPLIARYGGPFAWGPRWIAFAVGLVVVVPVTFGLLVEPGAFAPGPAGTPLCNYPASTMVLLAFYPWWSGTRTRLVAAVEYGVLGLVMVLPLLLLPIIDGPGTPVLPALLGGSYNLVGFVLGAAIGGLCRAGARDQAALQQRAYEEFFDFLHSHVKAGIAAVRAEWANPPVAREKLDELEQAVSDRRVQFLLGLPRVPLATLVSERVRAFTGVLRLEETPRVGAVTVPRDIGVLVGRALGDLLKNAAVHGASAVAVRLVGERGMLALEIADDGPGLDPAVLTRPGCSLYRLRDAAITLGGDLVAEPRPGGGTIVRLVVPFTTVPFTSVPVTATRAEGDGHGAGPAGGGPHPARRADRP